MAAGVTIKHKRKAGAFITEELQPGEVGVNTLDGTIEFSTSGFDVHKVVVEGAVERVITFGISGTDTGARLGIPLAFSGTIHKWKLSCDTNISTVLTILLNGSSISTSNKPTLSSDNFSESSTFTGWTTSVSENDILSVSVDSKSAADLVVFQLIFLT